MAGEGFDTLAGCSGGRASDPGLGALFAFTLTGAKGAVGGCSRRGLTQPSLQVSPRACSLCFAFRVIPAWRYRGMWRGLILLWSLCHSESFLVSERLEGCFSCQVKPGFVKPRPFEGLSALHASY